MGADMAKTTKNLCFHRMARFSEGWSLTSGSSKGGMNEGGLKDPYSRLHYVGVDFLYPPSLPLEPSELCGLPSMGRKIFLFHYPNITPI